MKTVGKNIMSELVHDVKCAEICLILEGSYPYVAGGVSSWVHDLIQAQSHLTFHLLILVAPDSEKKRRYSLPKNVVGTTEITLQRLPKGVKKLHHAEQIMQQIEQLLNDLTYDADLDDLASLLRISSPLRQQLGKLFLLDSATAWQMLLRMYRTGFSRCSFLDYFWSWRGLLGGMYSVILGELPQARVYHAVSTGYAGLYLARARLETGRPAMVTEHGIYTTERCIEIAMADWLHEEDKFRSMNVDKSRRDLQDMWMRTFKNYSRICYEACDQIITLFEGNQSSQLQNGSVAERMSVIPNGINYEYFSKMVRSSSKEKFVVALIGRVVPIKDVKTFIRAIAQVRESLADVQAYMIGPYDEDPEYYDECKMLVRYLGLESCFTFTGSVDLAQWLTRIDLIVLTSISEAQPLVILEAGAAGIPCVATDVGACREMIEGDKRESPALGKGGMIVPLSSPSLTAQAIVQLLSEPLLLQHCGSIIQQRVRLYYNKNDLDETYRGLYEKYCSYPSVQHIKEEVA